MIITGVILILLSITSIYFILCYILDNNNIMHFIINKTTENIKLENKKLETKINNLNSNINKKEDDIKTINSKVEQLQINISTLSTIPKSPPKSTENFYKKNLQYQSDIDVQLDQINLKLIELEKKLENAFSTIELNKKLKSSNGSTDTAEGNNFQKKLKYNLDNALAFWNNTPFDEESCLQWCKKHDWSVQFINDIFSLWTNSDSNCYLFVKRGVQFSRIKWAYDCSNNQHTKNVVLIRCPTELSIAPDMIEKFGPRNTWLDKIEGMISKKGIVEVEI